MDLKVKHMQENNRIAMVVGCIIQAFILAATILYAEDRDFPTAVIVAGDILAILVSIVGYIKWGKDERGHYPILLSMGATYMLILLGSFHTPYLYAFGFLIGICVVVYNDAHICKLAVMAAVGENLIYLILFYAKGYNKVLESRYNIITNFLFVILFAMICYMVISVNAKQNKEVMDDIDKRAAEQAESAKKIADTSAKIAAKLEDANDAMTSLSEKVHSSTEAVEQISSSVTMTAEAIQTQTEMNSNIMKSLENITGESKEMLELSNAVKSNVDKGNVIIRELEEQATETAEVNAQTAEMTDELAKSAETVKDIVNAILSISSQTNLLALNASIEAARAGEAGKGFAVVADEIRKLSEDTKTSAEEISATIDALIKNVENASGNMQKSVDSSNRQGELIKETGEKFVEILESVNILTKNVEEISENVSSCADATSVVMDSITDLSATSEEVAASSESSLTLSYECAKDMENTNTILGEILALSRN